MSRSLIGAMMTLPAHRCRRSPLPGVIRTSLSFVQDEEPFRTLNFRRLIALATVVTACAAMYPRLSSLRRPIAVIPAFWRLGIRYRQLAHAFEKWKSRSRTDRSFTPMPLERRKG